MAFFGHFMGVVVGGGEGEGVDSPVFAEKKERYPTKGPGKEVEYIHIHISVGAM